MISAALNGLKPCDFPVVSLSLLLRPRKTAGNGPFRTKPFEQALSRKTKHARNFLHRLNRRSHSPPAPKVQKLTSPVRIPVFPEELEIFLKQIPTDGFEVVPRQVGQFDFLVRREILRPFEQAPSRVRENRFQPLGSQVARFLGPNFINGLVHKSQCESGPGHGSVDWLILQSRSNTLPTCRCRRSASGPTVPFQSPGKAPATS